MAEFLDMDAFERLTCNIKFKGVQSTRPCEKSSTGIETVKRGPRVSTNDPNEACNRFRKLNGIRVHGLNIPDPVQTFKQLVKEFQLPAEVLRSILLQGFTKPTPIQSQALPLLLTKRDLVAISPTGSGKTLAFILPILAGLAEGTEHLRPYALLLAPTRELVLQTTRVIEEFKRKLHFRFACLSITQASAAGADFGKVDIVVTTPLRLSRLVRKKRIDLLAVQHLVLDEADKLLELDENPHTVSHQHQIYKIMRNCTHPSLVTSVFSATIPEAIEKLSDTFMEDPVRVTIGQRNATACNIQQQLQFVGSEEGKILMLQQLLEDGLKAPALIFVASKEKAMLLEKKLMGYRIDSIFSNKAYQERQRSLDAFRSGETWLLISTDVLARGIDFAGIETVLNFDCPASLDDYVHRIGRTGRGGKTGVAITFFTEENRAVIRSIAHMIASMGQDVPDWILSMKKCVPNKRSKKSHDVNKQ